MGLTVKRVLIVKTSSMGDVIHTLPAVTDAVQMVPGVHFDWLIEKPFAEIPAWHTAVESIITCEVRRWRQQIIATVRNGVWRKFINKLGQREYDLIIDAQGLVKSALLSRFARGLRHGFDADSARESWASRFYHYRHNVPRHIHAVQRLRQLFACSLGYQVPTGLPHYGVARDRLPQSAFADQAYLVFLHGTTWPTKHWPVSHWQRLARIVVDRGFKVYLPWGNINEYQRAKAIARVCRNVNVLPRLSLAEVAATLSGAKACVAVDTGLGHLAAALAVPTVSLYGPTNPILTGAVGVNQAHLAADFACAPCLQRECRYQGVAQVKPACFNTVSADKVWATVASLMIAPGVSEVALCDSKEKVMVDVESSN